MADSRFNKVLESVETLSLDEQEALIQVVQRRIVEKRRDEIAANIVQANVEYRSGQVFRGSVAEIMNELDK
ncbi:hypothetical protein [Rivularia sp. UHCC 0363]|uniref:hypothetical protein n=1 Tax=Rivularia sp. UHCC 0363 TaxID=3110244 RepID=UPI002B2086EC|nr:hypothetical protein [Rivularia sp. UHCC 0363]MEA5595166.1 hypothetical protein [Rivularia sp. UHCC 0363]